MPIFFGQLMLGALAKLHLSPDMALLLVMAIIIGGFINIPVKRIVRDELVPSHPLALLGMFRLTPQMVRSRRETIIAVNLGGCVVPAGVAVYELLHIAADSPDGLWAVAIASVVNIVACYLAARPIAGIGITMPGLLSPLVAATAALILAPEQASPVAFIAGVSGPLIGADLLHLGEVRISAVGIASIGGAGTFDGIVLSGIIAAYLA